MDPIDRSLGLFNICNAVEQRTSRNSYQPSKSQLKTLPEILNGSEVRGMEKGRSGLDVGIMFQQRRRDGRSVSNKRMRILGDGGSGEG